MSLLVATPRDVHAMCLGEEGSAGYPESLTL